MMTNKELTLEILKSNLDGEIKHEIIDLIYSKREENAKSEKPKIRKKKIPKEKSEEEQE